MHRDIKPDNIFLSSAMCIKIGDLGLGKQLGPRPGEQTHTVLVGGARTPTYMAPEQIEQRPHGVAIDVWAAGCLLFELSTGRLPFPNPAAVIQMREPPAATSWADGVVRYCLVKDERQRPSVSDVLRMLEQQAGGYYDPRDQGPMASYVSIRPRRRQRQG